MPRIYFWQIGKCQNNLCVGLPVFEDKFMFFPNRKTSNICPWFDFGWNKLSFDFFPSKNMNGITDWYCSFSIKILEYFISLSNFLKHYGAFEKLLQIFLKTKECSIKRQKFSGQILGNFWKILKLWKIFWKVFILNILKF